MNCYLKWAYFLFFNLETKWAVVQQIGENSQDTPDSNQYTIQLERMLVFLKDQKSKKALLVFILFSLM